MLVLDLLYIEAHLDGSLYETCEMARPLDAGGDHLFEYFLDTLYIYNQ